MGVPSMGVPGAGGPAFPQAGGCRQGLAPAAGLRSYLLSGSLH